MLMTKGVVSRDQAHLLTRALPHVKVEVPE